MRLVSIYIPKNSIPYLFGKNHVGQTVNFGGNWYSEITQQNNTINIETRPISRSIDSRFWGIGINAISAVVGRNGIGKTTLLRGINHKGDLKNLNLIYLFDQDDNLLIHNETKLQIECVGDYTEIPKNHLDAIKLYYSPIVDYKSLETKSPLNIIQENFKNIDQIFLKQFHQNVLFQNQAIFKDILEVYPDFPSYQSVRISIPKVRKFDLKNIYGTTNLGNEDRTRVVKTYIDSDITDLKDGKWDYEINDDPKSFIEKSLKGYIDLIESSSLNRLFNELWELKEYKTENDQDHIHDGNDFIKNFEVLVFSYLILDATFPGTPFQGRYDAGNLFLDIDFNDRLNNFLHLYFSQVYGDVTEGLIEKFGRIEIENYQNIKDFVNESRHRKWKMRGFESKKAVEALNFYLERFKSISELYIHLQETIKNNQMTLENGTLNFNVADSDMSIFSSLIRQYESTISTFENVVTDVTLLSFDSNQILSSGENALISFYSRLSNYINKIKSKDHRCYDYYLLLLDEPELGYHPYWKKKFVDAITKTLPIIFSEIKAKKTVIDGSDIEDNNTPEIQVIFSTHDPLTLSDIPSSNVVYFDRNIETEKTIVVDNVKEKRVTFGANITDLLADSFFLDDGLVGEFAKKKIDEVIEWLNLEKNKETESSESIKYFKDMIEIIDEPILKIKLLEMYAEKTGESVKNKILDEQIEYLKRLKDD